MQRWRGHAAPSQNNHSRYQKLKEVKFLPLEYLMGVWPCQHLNFQILSSRILTDCVYVVFSHQRCGNLFQQP